MNDFDRQKLLLKFADLIEANQEYLASLTRVALGAPYKPFGKSEIETAIGCFRCESRTGDDRVNAQLLKKRQTMRGGWANLQDKAFQAQMDSTRSFGMSPWVSLQGMNISPR